MKTIANIIWIILGGLISAVVWCILGFILCITVIGIPFGKQCFKMAGVSLAPFGKRVKLDFSKHPIMNVVWLLLVGWELFLGYLVAALLCCITIVGIPAGMQVFKLSVLALAPFGAKVKG
ncbi:MAG: YccF domain-containing protein [Ruminococcaceae bacterium]|nr:YccF domain-containing protein [Oscillospiraceae bacterium]